MEPLAFGIVGLGRMGAGLAIQARSHGMRVVGYDVNKPSKNLVDKGIEIVKALDDLPGRLPSPRVVFLYVPAGPVVDKTMEQLASIMKNGDIIADGGNSYWGDSIRRHKRLSEKGVHLVDVGTSGGVSGAREGACFMVGGEPEAVRLVEPILTRLAVPGGFVHAGPPGAGHFVKLVHNGIEFGMLEAIGEGMSLLSAYRDQLDMDGVLSCWRHGSVIRSWLIDLMEQGYRETKSMKDIPAYVEDTGEVNWLVSDALHMEVPIPVISQSVMQLFASRDDTKNWAKAIAVMRHGFGGHPYGRSEPIVRERQTGRIADYQAGRE